MYCSSRVSRCFKRFLVLLCVCCFACLGISLYHWTGRLRITVNVNLEKKANISHFLLVAVMTTRKYLDTRARAVYKTWGKHVPGKIVFFVGGKTGYHGELPVIVLKDINDNQYPPIRKSFAMLQYIATYFINDYQWFMRADDDVFVKTDRLKDYLKSFNSSKLFYVGRPTLGNPYEKLGLINGTRYCGGGNGVIFTSSTLRIVAKYLPLCLSNTFSKHEDSELGRCVQQHVGIWCHNTSSVIERYFYHHGHPVALPPKLGYKYDNAITIHAFKNSDHMYYVYKYFEKTA